MLKKRADKIAKPHRSHTHVATPQKPLPPKAPGPPHKKGPAPARVSGMVSEGHAQASKPLPGVKSLKGRRKKASR